MSELLTAGACVDGRYILQSRLGEGTFGGVWRARDARLSDRLVAVKFLKEEFLEQPATVARFEAEGEALAKVSHPNVVAVIDRGAWQGQRYLVTEFVDGHPLSAWIDAHRRGGTRPPVSTALAIFDQLCAGMEAAHAVRAPGPVVHRDLKPENVLVREATDGAAVKIVDFGIAQLGGRKSTRTGAMMGTPLYMAPEQAMGNTAAIGPWTDVFALGVILTEALTLQAQVEEGEPWWGTALHRGGSVRALLAALGPDVPGAVWDVVATCLKAQGRERFQHAGALRAAMRDAGVTVFGSATASSPPFTLGPAALDFGPTVPTPSRDSTVPGDLAPLADPPAPTPSVDAVDGSSSPTPWAKLLLVVVALSAALAAVVVSLVVRADHRRTLALADAGRPRAASPEVLTDRSALQDPALATLLRGWKAAVERPDADLAAYYAPRVRWHSSDVVGTAAEVARFLRENVAAGGFLRVDLDGAAVVVEAPESPDVAGTCRDVPGVAGPVLRVRARAEERRPQRNPAIPCATLRGVYLLRVRAVGGSLRICHETWSLADGICASCPTARVCPHPP
ncbi:MAG: serine/threonine-protein kinase [Polyangiales bacterium]